MTTMRITTPSIYRLEKDNMKIDFDLYTTSEIHHMIAKGDVTNDEVIAFYNNEWWDFEHDEDEE